MVEVCTNSDRSIKVKTLSISLTSAGTISFLRLLYKEEDWYLD